MLHGMVVRRKGLIQKGCPFLNPYKSRREGGCLRLPASEEGQFETQSGNHGTVVPPGYQCHMIR